MQLASLVFFVAGLALLIVGAWSVVRGASGLAAAIGVSPLVAGLTVVAYGTSAPELAVSVGAAATGRGDIALGNVIGSNIVNILLILGISAAILPLAVSRHLVRVQVPLMIAVSLLLYGVAFDGVVARSEGIFFVVALVLYTLWSYRIGRRNEDGAAAPAGAAERPRGRWPAQVGLVAVGLALLVLGARWLVDAAVDFARLLGVSELVIGLTIVAAGTSLPEAATSVVAVLRGERDIAVGNVVGSNVFNILAVLGLSALVAPGGINVAPAALHFDIPVMFATAVACLPIFFTAHRIERWEGFLFLGYYLAYIAYVILDATDHDAQGPFSAIMLWFVIPLTAITLSVLALQAFRARAPVRR